MFLMKQGGWKREMAECLEWDMANLHVINVDTFILAYMLHWASMLNY